MASLEVLLNEVVSGSFLVSCRIRQGDPLSPFLFIIVTELLSRILYHAEALGWIHEVKASCTALAIMHLLFMDDLILFYRSGPLEVCQVLKCLYSYCKWIGQCVNYSKFGVIFSKNICGQ